MTKMIIMDAVAVTRCHRGIVSRDAKLDNNACDRHRHKTALSLRGPVTGRWGTGQRLAGYKATAGILATAM
jgi:hypothetical protein